MAMGTATGCELACVRVCRSCGVIVTGLLRTSRMQTMMIPRYEIRLRSIMFKQALHTRAAAVGPVCAWRPDSYLCTAGMAVAVSLHVCAIDRSQRCDINLTI